MPNWLQSFWTWLRGIVGQLVAALHPYLAAYAKNLATVGITDVRGFMAAAEPVALAAGAAAIASGGSGAAVLAAVRLALIPIAIQFGAAAERDALTAVLNTTAELLHQPTVALRAELVPPDAAHTLGSGT